jgi:hypothetical protein
MGSHAKEAVLQASLPFHAGRVRVEARLEHYATKFNQQDRSFDLGCSRGAGPFLSRSVGAGVGQTKLFAAVHTGVTYVSSADEPFATFLLPFFGSARFRVEGRQFRLTAGESAVYMAGQARRCETALAGGTCIQLSRQRLAAKAAELSGDPGAEGHYRDSFERPWEFSETVPLQRTLLAVIRRSLGLIDLVPEGATGGADALRIEDLLYRSVVLLARPELFRPT